MFREIRKIKNKISEDATKKLLREGKRGTLALIGEGGYPYAIPMNFYYDEAEEAIYFHSAKRGYKIDCIEHNPKACFTLYGDKTLSSDGWSYEISSAVVFGTLELVEDKEVALEKVRTFARKYYPSHDEVEEELERGFHAVQCLKFKIHHMRGKRVGER